MPSSESEPTGSGDLSTSGGDVLLIKPSLTSEGARRLAEDRYGLKVREVRSMVSYDDLNFHITTEAEHTNPHLDRVWAEGYTMKIVNSKETAEDGFLEAIQRTFLYLKSKGLEVPVPVPNIHGDLGQKIHRSKMEENLGAAQGVEDSDPLFAVHLLTYLPGKPLSAVQYTPQVLKEVGKALANVISAFKDYSNEVLEKRDTMWSLYSVPKVRNYAFAVRDAPRRQLVHQVIRDFEEQVLPAAKHFPQGVIHGDLNEHNLLVSPSLEVSGILDLGDLQVGPRVFEVAVCALYSMLGGEERLGSLDPLLAPAYILAGLQDQVHLEEEERTLLKPCMEARLAQSLTMGEYTFHLNPTNDYTLDSARFGWTILERLRDTDPQELLSRWDRVLEEDLPISK